MERQDLLVLVQRRIVEPRNRRSETLRERLEARRGEATEKGRLGAGFYFAEQEKDCAKELAARADYWMTILKEVLDAAEVAVDEALQTEIIAFLRQQLVQDYELLHEELRRMIKPHGARYTGGMLDEAKDRQLSHIEAELQHYALQSQSRVVPLAEALGAPRYAGVREFWEKAMRLQGDGDMGGACKEAISAVEAAAQIVLQDPSLTLGDAIKRLRADNSVSRTILSAIEKLWGWASETPGVRHGDPDGISVDPVEGQFLLDGAAASLRLFMSLDRAA